MQNRKSFNLPPIVPIVLYNVKGKWTAKHEFRQLLANEAMFGSELLNFEYLLIDVERYSEKELLLPSNTLSTVFMLDQTDDQEQLRIRLNKLMRTIQRLPEEGQQKFMTWMSHILRQQLPEHEPVIQQLLNHNMKGV